MSSSDRKQGGRYGKGTTGASRNVVPDSTVSTSVTEWLKARRKSRRVLPSLTSAFPVLAQLDLDLDWKITGFGLFIETLQLIGLTFNSNLNWGPVFGGSVVKIVYFFDFPLFDSKWADNTYIAAAVFFWAFFAMLAGWGAVVGYYSFQELHKLPQYLVYYTRTVLHAVVSFGLIPVAMTFCSFLVCAPRTGREHRVLFWFGQRHRCLHGYTGVAFVFGVVGLLLLCIVAAAGTVFVYDDMPNSANLPSRAGCSVTGTTTAVKLISVILYHVLLSQGYAQPYAATLCVLYGLLAIGYVIFLPYYSLRMNQFRTGQMFVTAAFAGVAAVDVRTDMLWHRKSISTAIVLILSVVGFLFGWFVTRARVNPLYLVSRQEHHMRRQQRRRQEDELQECATSGCGGARRSIGGAAGELEEEAAALSTDPREFPRYLPATDLIFTPYPGLESLLLHPSSQRGRSGGAGHGSAGGYDSDSAEGREMARRSEVTEAANEENDEGDGLDGVLLDPYITAVRTPSDVELATRFLRAHVRRTGSVVTSLPPQLCAYAGRLYLKGMVKFPNDPEIRYHFCLFLVVYAKRLRMGLGELSVLTQTFDGRMSLRLQFRIYRLRERVKQVLGVSNTHQSHLIALSREAHREVLAGMAAFWDSLTTAYAPGRLSSVADYISSKREECRSLYTKTIQAPDEGVLMGYSRFLRDIMLDVEAADALRSRVLEESNMHKQQQAARLAAMHDRMGGGGVGTETRESTAGNGLPAMGASATDPAGLVGTGSSTTATAVPHDSEEPELTAGMAVGNLIITKDGKTTHGQWHACQQLIKMETHAQSTYHLGNNNGPDQGHFSRSAREIRSLRIAVYTLSFLVVSIALGLAIFAGVRTSALNRAKDRISAANDVRLYFSLGVVLVGQLTYFNLSGVPAAAIADKLEYLRSEIGSCADIVRTAHYRLTQGDLFTGEEAISTFINSRRTEVVEVGQPSLEGPNSRTLTDLHSLGTRVANTFASLSKDPSTVSNYEELATFVTVNAQQHTLPRAFNHSVELYVDQRTKYLTSSIWVVVVFVMIGIFLLLIMYAIVRVYLHRIVQAKISTINLFALIPRSYAEDLLGRSRDRLHAFVEEKDADHSISTTAAAATGNDYGTEAETQQVGEGVSNQGTLSSPVITSTKDTGSNREAASAKRALPMAASLDHSGLHGCSLRVRRTPVDAPGQRANEQSVDGTSLTPQATLISSHAGNSSSRGTHALQNDEADIDNDFDGAGHGEFSAKQIAQSSANDYGGGNAGIDDQLQSYLLDSSGSGSSGDKNGGSSEYTVHAIKAIAGYLSSPYVVVGISCLCAVLSAVCFGLSYQLQVVSQSVSDEGVTVSEFRELTARFYEYMSTTGRHAQQYVITGDLVHVERYYTYTREHDPQQWFDFAMIEEQSTAAVAALVKIRTLLNSALLRQQIALWLASLLYGVPQDHKNLFARIDAVRRPYNFASMQAAAQELFANFHPVVATPTASTPEIDENRPKDEQLAVARHLVFDDYYQAHRFQLVAYLQEAIQTHTDNHASLTSSQRGLWVALIAMESIIIALVVVVTASYLVNSGPVLARIGLLIVFSLAAASLGVLGASWNAMVHAETIFDDYAKYIQARNSSIITLGSTQDYALRVQQMGYASALQEWTKNRHEGTFNNSLTSIVAAWLSSAPKEAVTAASTTGADLFVFSQHLAYLSDVSAALSTAAYHLQEPAPLAKFRYNRELERTYQSDFLRFGGRDHLYTNTAADLMRASEQQKEMALSAVAGPRFEFVAANAFHAFTATVNGIGDVIMANLEEIMDRVQTLTNANVALVATLMGVCMLTTLYAIFSAVMQETERLTSSTRAAAAAGHDEGATTTAGLRVASRRRRARAVMLFLVTLIGIGLFVGALVVGLHMNNHELITSQMLNLIKARDWVLSDTIIRVQRVWHETADPLLVSPYMTDMIRSFTTMMRARVELYLGNGNGFPGVLTQSPKQGTELFGSAEYTWESYRGVCRPFTATLGSSLLDFPRPPTAAATEEQMLMNLLVFGAENALWQMLGVLLTTARATSTAATQKYELPLISVFPSLTEYLRASSTTYFQDRANSAEALIAFFIVIIVALIIVLVAGLLFVIRPILLYLAREEESTRLLLRMIPDHVRRDVPAITDFFTTGSINKDAELISIGCRDIQSTALVVVSSDDTIFSATEEALRQFQRTADEVIGSRFETLLSKDSGAKFTRSRMEMGRSRLAALTGKETRTVGRRSDGALFPVSTCVREVFSTVVNTKKQSLWWGLFKGQGSGGSNSSRKRSTSLSAAGTSDASVFVVRFTDAGVKSDLEFIRRMQAMLFDNCRQPQAVLDATGYVRMVNHAALRLFRQASETMVNAHLSALLQADGAQETMVALDDLLAKSRALSTSVTTTVRVAAPVKDGPNAHLEIQMTTVMGKGAPEARGQNTPSGHKDVIVIVMHMRDISQELYVQQADLVSKAIIDLSPVPVIIFDDSSRVLNFSVAAERSWGCKAESVIGLPLHELLSATDSGGGYDLAYGQHSDLKHFLSGTNTLTGRRRNNGETFLLEVTIRDLVRSEVGKSGSTTVTYIGYFRDLSAETKLATRNVMSCAVFDSCPLAVVVADDYGRIVIMNPAADRVFGFASGEAIGKDVSLLMPGHMAQRHSMFVKAYRETGQRSFVDAKPRSEFARRADGRLFTVELSLRELAVTDPMEDFRAPLNAAMEASSSISNGDSGSNRNAAAAAARSPSARTRRLVAAYLRDTSYELHASRANSIHEAVIRNSPVPMMSVDEDGVIQFVNPALASMFRYDPSSLLGRSAAKTLFPGASRALAASEASPRSSCVSGGTSWRSGRGGGGGGEHPRETFDGLVEASEKGPATAILTARDAECRDFPLLVCIHALDRGDEKHHHLNLSRLFVVSLRDVEHRTDVDAETFLERACVSSYPGSVLVMTERGAVRYLSGHARRLFNLPDSVSTTGLHVSSLFASCTKGNSSNTAGGACSGGVGSTHRSGDDSGLDSRGASPLIAQAAAYNEPHSVTEELIAAAINGPTASTRGSTSSPGHHGGVNANNSDGGGGGVNTGSNGSGGVRRDNNARGEPHCNSGSYGLNAGTANGAEDEGVPLLCVPKDGLPMPVVVRVRRIRGVGGSSRDFFDRTSSHSRTEPVNHSEVRGASAAGSSSPGSLLHSNAEAGTSATYLAPRQGTGETYYALLIRDPIEDNAVEQNSAIENAILDQLSLGVIQVDTNGTMLSVNDAILRILRYPSAVSVIGRNVGILTPASAAHHSSGKDGNAGTAEPRTLTSEDDEVIIRGKRLMQLLAGGDREPGLSHEVLAVRSDGTQVYISITIGEPLSATGEAAQPTAPARGSCFFFIRDVDLEVQARNRQRLLTDVLKTSPVATLIVEGVSATAPIRLFNGAAQRLFQRTQEEASHQGVGTFLTTGGRSIIDAYYAQRANATVALEGVTTPALGDHRGCSPRARQSSTSMTASGKRQDGTTFPAMVHVADFFYEEMSQHCLLLLIEDITSEVMLEFERAASRTIEDVTPYAIICFNEAREVLLFSKQAEALFQCRESDMIGRSVTTLVSEQTAKLFDSIFTEVITSGSTAMRGTPHKAYRQVAKRLGSANGSSESVFPSEWVFYELTPQASPDVEVAVNTYGNSSHVFVALVRDTSSATSDIIAGAISTAAINALSIPFIAFSNVGVITMANSAVTTLLGYDSHTELLGHNIRMLLGPHVASRLAASMQAFCERHQRTRCTLTENHTLVTYITGKRKDGENISLELLLGMLPSPESVATTVCAGDALQLAHTTAASLGVTWYGFLYEVGEKVSIKKQLIFTEAIATMENLAVLFVNHQGIITYAGESARQMFGSDSREFPWTELEGKPLSAILRKADPFHAFVAEFESVATKAATANSSSSSAAKRPRSIPMVGQRLGREALFSCTVQLTRARSGDADASYTCLITSSADREAAENSAQLMEAADGISMMPVIVCDEKGLIHYVNKRALVLFRYDRIEEMVGQGLSTVMTPAEAAAHSDHLVNYLRGFKRNSSVVKHTRRVIGTRKDKTSVAIDITVDETVTLSGAHRFVAYMDDLTDAVRAEGAVRMVNSVLASLPEMVFVVSGGDGKVMQVSCTCTTRLRLPKELVVDRPFSDFFALPTGGSAAPSTDAKADATLLSIGVKPVVVLPSAGVSASNSVQTTLTVSRLEGVDEVTTLLCHVKDW